MSDANGHNPLTALRCRWIATALLRCSVLAAGAAVLLSAVLAVWLPISYAWGFLYFLILFLLLAVTGRIFRVTTIALAHWLNQQWPELQESSDLLLQPASRLNLLQALQYRRAADALATIRDPLQARTRLARPLLAAVLMAVLALVVYLIPGWKKANVRLQNSAVSRSAAAVSPVTVSGMTISIYPPAYTNRPQREQHEPNLVSEQGSSVEWSVVTSQPATQVSFVFNDTLTVPLKRNAADSNSWHLSRKIDTTGFYQLSVDGKISPLYKIETIIDQQPVITIRSPKPYTVIDIGEPQQVAIGGMASDDYGLTDVHLSATVATGSGEAVKFKEQRMAFPGFHAAANSQLQLTLRLPELGMHPGDELYFYVQATDNNRQQVKSDVYIVHLPDTAQLMSLDGIANNLNLKPEYFRSQRQIIIETEQLLKDRDTLTEQVFKDRSNNLGIDQKMLRLRYGKFLGDENESGESGINDVAAIEDFSNADKIRETFTDKHDNAEDATFYTADTKKQLRATLAEMWNAEMKLRTFSPRLALPFEYKALRLLKDLQQQDRLYVAKTNFKTTPPDPGKRLSGDLTRIQSYLLQKNIHTTTDPQTAVRQSLAILEAARSGNIGATGSLQILQQANLQLHEKAIRQPSDFLPAVESMKKILEAWNGSASIALSDLLDAEKGLQKMLAAPLPVPAVGRGGAAHDLSKAYFDNLQKSLP